MFTPKSRLEKILCGVAATAKTRLEKAVAIAIGNAGGGGGSSVFETSVTLDSDTGAVTINDVTAAELYEALASGKLVKTSLNVGGASINAVTCVSGQVVDDGLYTFWMEQPEMKMVSGKLSAEDSVVLSPFGE